MRKQEVYKKLLMAAESYYISGSHFYNGCCDRINHYLNDRNCDYSNIFEQVFKPTEEEREEYGMLNFLWGESPNLSHSENRDFRVLMLLFLPRC